MACSRLIAVAAAIFWFGAVVDAQDEARRPARESGTLFERLDANKDGTLTKEEVPEERQRLFARLLRSSDKDSDGKLAREEFAAGLQDQPREAGETQKRRSPFSDSVRMAGGTALLRALDADGDGKLSSGEIENAAAALKKLDKNGDGSLTRDEFGPPGGLAGGAFAGDGSAMLDRVRELDKNKDGKWNKEELPPRLQERFDALDANKDGSLGPEELRQGLRRQISDRPRRGQDASPKGADPTQSK